MAASTAGRGIPALGKPRPLKLPRTAERTLPNGLTVIAVRRPAVPLVELRLRVPFARTPLARGSVLGHTLFSGTSTMSTVDIAAALQRVGGGLSAGADCDRLMISGNALSSGLDRLLEVLAEVLTDAAYPAGEVRTEKERLADRIRVARTQPGHAARVALQKRIYAGHPYAVQVPEPEQVLGVRPAGLRDLHGERVHPPGAVLVLVGDVGLDRALDTAEHRLSAWNGGGKEATLPALPRLRPGPIGLVHRPGSVQSSIRMALAAVGRTHPDHAALQLANLVFGGFFSSRLTENIREDKGYTYSPNAAIEHAAAGSTLVVSADVATEVTAPALLEMGYELGRIANLPVGAEELELARQYILGTLQLGIATQSGLAGLVTTYAGQGLRLEWLAEHARRLARTSAADVAAAGFRYLAPASAVTVVLGDADATEAPLRTLAPVDRS